MMREVVSLVQSPESTVFAVGHPKCWTQDSGLRTLDSETRDSGLSTFDFRLFHGREMNGLPLT